MPARLAAPEFDLVSEYSECDFDLVNQHPELVDPCSNMQCDGTLAHLRAPVRAKRSALKLKPATSIRC